MTTLTPFRCLLLLTSVVLYVGCGKSKPAGPQGANNAASPAGPATDTLANEKAKSGGDQEPDATEKTNTTKAGGAPPSARPTSKTADAAIIAVIDGLKQNKPEAVWHFLPASYQKDVNDLVHDFAGRVDPELWSRFFATAKKITNVLKTKKEFILENPALKGAQKVNPEEVAANWDGLVGLLATMVNSEISDVEKLKKIDVGQYMAETGGSLMNQLAAISKLSPNDPFNNEFRKKLSDVKVTLISSEGETAMVKLVPPEGSKDEPKDVEFVKVEGKWIPKPLAEGWAPKIEQIRAQITADLAPESIAAKKPQILKTLDGYDQFLDQLQKAETAEQFDAMFAPLLGAVLSAFQKASGMPGPGGGPAIPASTPKGKNTVTIIIQAELDEKSEDAITQKLLDAVDNPDLGLAAPAVKQGTTRIELSPVKDIKAFAKKIEFGKVIGIDEKKRTITIELKDLEKKSSTKKKSAADKKQPQGKQKAK